jgi:hypothetical protein
MVGRGHSMSGSGESVRERSTVSQKKQKTATVPSPRLASTDCCRGQRPGSARCSGRRATRSFRERCARRGKTTPPGQTSRGKVHPCVEPVNNSIRGWVSPFLPFVPVHCKDIAPGYQDLLSKTAVPPPIDRPDDCSFVSVRQRALCVTYSNGTPFGRSFSKKRIFTFDPAG